MVQPLMHHFSKNGVPMRKLTDQQKIDIVEKYLAGDATCAQLGREYGVNPTTISRMLQVRGIKIDKDVTRFKRKYDINHQYFDVIDSESKAYFLGLLYADGCNHSSNDRFSIALQEEDKEILERFSAYISSEYPLVYLESRDIYNKTTGKIYTCKPLYQFGACSKKISDTLTNLGCFSNKSLVLEFPTEQQVPSYLIRHFIRGYFDGDGSFSVGKRTDRKDSIVLSTDITGSTNFCLTLRDVIKIHVDINFQIRQPYNCTNKTGNLRSSGTRQVYRFLNWLYSDCDLYLKRKYDKYLSVKDELIRRKLIVDDKPHTETQCEVLRTD